MKKIIFNILVNIAYFLLLLIGKTSRVVYLNKENSEKVEKKYKKVVYAFFHNRLLYLAYAYRKTMIGVMVSQHRDGDYITGVIKKCKFKAIRGSTTRGGIRALIEIINYSKEGYSIALTPDGPKGPKYSIQEGILLAGLKTGLPIVPVCWNAMRKKVFNSWDNFILPYPFNKFVLVYGEPVIIKNKNQLKIKKNELYKNMMQIVNIADNYKF